jgi:PAS domain S-box-containing protein
MDRADGARRLDVYGRAATPDSTDADDAGGDVTGGGCACESPRELDGMFRSLLEAAPDAMVIADRDGRIILVNAQTERLFGYTRAELLGNDIEQLVPEQFRRAHAGHRVDYGGAPRVRTMGCGMELWGRRKDGSVFPVEISLSPLQTDAGLLISSAVRDVTERRRVEDALRQAKEAAETASRELEAFSYSVAHDLRAPLRAINGFSVALVEDLGDKLGHESREHLQRIRTGAERMAQLIDALLGLARLSRTPIAGDPVDLSELAHEVVGQLRAAEPGRAVECVIAERMPTRGDPRLLRVLLYNLLGNAWRFSARRDAARVEVGASDDGACYFVRDNGAGFDMAYAHKLFVPFQRLHPPGEFEGTGIGLATAQRIVQRHGGRIWAEGAVDRGATFHFTLAQATAAR